jgi:cyclopropane fatty-acyl-phospholipid synthase-like methyltransferase
VEKQYYKAYEDRYRQVHSKSLRWFAESPTPIVYDILREFRIHKHDRLLEIGCGEGRDAGFLLKNGYNLLATDISQAAVEFCCRELPEYKENFRVMDCLKEECPEQFEFIYAVAVIHMLVPDGDRAGFYRFIREHLTETGIALICSMGDGIMQQQSDISKAFDLQDRIHAPTGLRMKIASTSYRAVSFATFENEIKSADLKVMKKGVTVVEPDYGNMMYAVVKKADL